MVDIPLFNKLTLSVINEYFYIENSKLKWKIRKANCIHIGDHVGTTRGYISVQFNGKIYKAHRIMYQIYNNIEELDDEYIIDHVDGNKLNNSKENLRISSIAQNNMNAKIRKDNTTGYKNICVDYLHGKKCYCVRIQAIKSYRIKKRFEYSDDGLKNAIEFRNHHMKILHGDFTRLV